MTLIPSFRPLPKHTGLVIAGLSLVLLQGCMVRTAAMSAVSTVTSAVGTAASAAGSAAGAGASAASKAALGSASSGKAATTGGAAAGAAGLAAAASAPPAATVTDLSLTETLPSEGFGSVQQVYVEAPHEAVTDAIKQCLNRLDAGKLMVGNASALALSYQDEKLRPETRTTVLSTVTAEGKTAFEEVTAAPVDQGTPLLTATVSPGRACNMDSTAIGVANTKAIAYAAIEDSYPGSFRLGSPSGTTGPCDGYTLSLLDGTQQIWLRFTDAAGHEGACNPTDDAVHLIVTTELKDA